MAVPTPSRFEACLRAGEYYQTHYLNELDLTDWNVEIASGYAPDWDLRLTHKTAGNSWAYEVKSDTVAARTGNLAIEFECSGRPSGIAATKADYWIHYIPTTNTYYRLKVETLKKIIKRVDPWTTYGGDGGRARMYLLPISHLEKYKNITQHSC